MTKDKGIYRILVVEDNPGDYMIVEDFLGDEIMTPFITRAANFKEASAALSVPDAAFDVILLDLTLPDKSGEQLLTDMMLLAGFTPIIILTGYTNIDFSTRSIAQGIFDYILKDDLTSAMLYKSIVYTLERKKSIDQLVRSEKRYSDLFHLSPQPMWLYDQATLQFIQVNNAAVVQYGYSEEEFLGMTILDIREKKDVEMIKIITSRPGREEGVYTGKFRHRKKSGEIIEVQVYSTPIVINDKQLRSVIAIDLTERNQYEHRITKAIIKAQDDERYEIGGELHDNVCQLLVATQLSLGMLRKQLNPENMKWYEQSRNYIGCALEEIRNLSHRLAPAFFNHTNLEEAFRRLLTDLNVEQKFESRLYFEHSIEQEHLPRDIQLTFYRILQEHLKNIIKYADARFITVEVLLYNGILIMKVTDDGVGFNTREVKKGIGIANMKRRAELFSGEFLIESSPGHGCVATVKIPLPVLN